VSNTEICEKCRYKNSWDCEDGYYRRPNCEEFVLEWHYLTDKEKTIVKQALESKLEEET